MVIPKDNIPLFFQFYLRIKNDIVLQEIPPGSRIETIEVLHTRYGVSHSTVRKAMELLEREGLIVRKRALGTFVRDDVDLVMWNPSASRDDIRTALLSMNTLTLEDGWIAPPRRIQAIFEGRDDVLREGRLYHRKGLLVHREDARRKRLSEVFIPAWVMEGVDPQHFGDTTVYETLEDRKGLKPIRIVQTIRPWLCDADSGRILDLPEGTPVFWTSRVFQGADGSPLYCAESMATVNALVMEIDIDETETKRAV